MFLSGKIWDDTCLSTQTRVVWNKTRLFTSRSFCPRFSIFLSGFCPYLSAFNFWLTYPSHFSEEAYFSHLLCSYLFDTLLILVNSSVAEPGSEIVLDCCVRVLSNEIGKWTPKTKWASDEILFLGRNQYFFSLMLDCLPLHLTLNKRAFDRSISPDLLMSPR